MRKGKGIQRMEGMRGREGKGRVGRGI